MRHIPAVLYHDCLGIYRGSHREPMRNPPSFPIADFTQHQDIYKKIFNIMLTLNNSYKPLDYQSLRGEGIEGR